MVRLGPTSSAVSLLKLSFRGQEKAPLGSFQSLLSRAGPPTGFLSSELRGSQQPAQHLLCLLFFFWAVFVVPLTISSTAHLKTALLCRNQEPGWTNNCVWLKNWNKSCRKSRITSCVSCDLVSRCLHFQCRGLSEIIFHIIFYFKGKRQ